MRGKLKNVEFRIGYENAFSKVTGGIEIEITDSETHSIWGKRYKIYGFDEWFEENCFDYVEEEDE